MTYEEGKKIECIIERIEDFAEEYGDGRIKETANDLNVVLKQSE